MVDRTGYLFPANTNVFQNAGEITDHIKTELSVDAMVTVPYDGDGDGVADEILVTIAPGDEVTFEAGLGTLKTYLKNLESAPLPSSVEIVESVLTIKKRFNLAGGEIEIVDVKAIK